MALARHPMNFNSFLDRYTHTDTKAQEAVAILELVQEMKQEQAQEISQTKETLLKEMRIEDLATKADIEKLRLETKAEIEKLRLELQLYTSKEISQSKWQIIGTVILVMVVPIIAKHFGW